MFRFRQRLPRRRRLTGRFRLFLYSLRRNQLIKALGAIFAVAFVAAAAVTMVEGHVDSAFRDLGSGLWWALVTMTTVGYGDMVPGTLAGRLLATIVMLSGVALVSVFTAALSSRVITNRLKEGRGLSKVHVKNHIAILGWNASVEDIIRAVRDDAILENRSLVLINQLKPEVIEPILHKYQDLLIRFVYGDPTSEDALERANVRQAYAAIIVADESNPGTPKSDERTILTTLSVKALEPKVKVVAHIMDAANEAHLRRANADRIVIDNRYSGPLLGAHATRPGIPETFDMLLNVDGDIRLGRRKIPHGYVGRTFADLADHFKREEDAILLGFVKEAPGFTLGDILSDDYSTIDAFIRNKLEAAGKGLDKKARVEVELNPAADYRISERDVAIVIERIA